MCGGRFTELVVPAAELEQQRTFGLHHAAAHMHIDAVTDEAGAPLHFRALDHAAPIRPLVEPAVVSAKTPTAKRSVRTPAPHAKATETEAKARADGAMEAEEKMEGVVATDEVKPVVEVTMEDVANDAGARCA